MKSINFNELKQWRYAAEDILINSYNPNAVDIIQAMPKELQNWKEHNVYSNVDSVGQRCISTRWVISEKMKDEKSVLKARLLYHGFEEENLDDIRKDSPTCS